MRAILSLCLLVLLVGCTPPPVVVPTAKPMPKQVAGKTEKLTIDVPEVGEVLCSVNVAESYNDETPAPLILLLHYGYEGAKPEAHTGADMIDTFGSAISGLEGIAIAPDVVGGDWTSEKNEKAAVYLVKSAMKTYNIDPKRVIVTGYSMGGAGAWFIGSRHQDTFTAAIPVAAPIAGSDEFTIPVRVIHSPADSIVPYAPAKSRYEKIKAAGGNIEFIEASGLDHYNMPGYVPHFNRAVESIKNQW